MTKQRELHHALRRWAGVFTRRSMREFMHSIKDSGLSMSQQSTLMRIRFHGPCPVSDIAHTLGVSPAAASQMVDKMVVQGFLERSEDAHDRRVKRISLTPQGLALVNRGIEARLIWMQELATKLSQEEQSDIISALTSLTEAAEQLERSNQGTEAIKEVEA